MSLALSIPPDADGIESLIEPSIPSLIFWLIAIALCVAIVVVLEGAMRIKRRSPVEQLLRRRFG